MNKRLTILCFTAAMTLHCLLTDAQMLDGKQGEKQLHRCDKDETRNMDIRFS